MLSDVASTDKPEAVSRAFRSFVDSASNFDLRCGLLCFRICSQNLPKKSLLQRRIAPRIAVAAPAGLRIEFVEIAPVGLKTFLKIRCCNGELRHESPLQRSHPCRPHFSCLIDGIDRSLLYNLIFPMVASIASWDSNVDIRKERGRKSARVQEGQVQIARLSRPTIEGVTQLISKLKMRL